MTLDDLLEPESTAVVTVEMQRAVVGDLAVLTELREAATEVGMVEHAAVICAAARRVGVRVVHCTSVFRPDRAGSVTNCRLLAATVELMGDRLDEGRPGADLVPALEVAPSDLVVPRHHGLTPFPGTGLDQTLRNVGVTTIVAVGCSLNIALTGLVLNAVDLGYQVVVPEDAVVGVPVEYGRSVLANSLDLLATVVTSAEVVARWDRG